ncbi:MAG TPA: SDR family NAD(P)-dependent oxidoreductase [Candidatus Baltobacteraceae bacterium]|nr:SDR family NAD(P)-dependent oxidoreductase [Candidatus Baltobacteraceae bacterium]
MRSIVVTGASSGIGAALARLCVERGWKVLAVARRAERLENVRGATTLALDVTARDAPARIVEAALAAFGGIDVVVNNAGAARPGALLEQSDAAIDAQWQLHVAAPLRIARAALPHVRARHGGLVFLGSGLARVPAPGYGAYASAKAGIRAAAIQLRRELRADGVFVTYVDPGVVDTDFSLASGMESRPAWWHASPDDVAARILRGISRRAHRVNAVGWQTAGTVLGEWFPAIADAAMASLVTPPAEPEASAPIDAPSSPIAETFGDPFDAALAPLQRRMERVKLSEAFVRSLLVPGTEIALHDAAMHWAGMPNKNERAALHEVLSALEAAGFLQNAGEERWSVLRAARDER